MDIDFEILGYSAETAHITVKYTVAGNPDGITLVMPLPVENGVVVTDPAKVAAFLVLSAPRHSFEREAARLAYLAQPVAERETARRALVGMKRTITPEPAREVPTGQPGDSATMRIGKIKVL